MNVDFYDYLSFLLQECDIAIDYELLMEVYSFLNSLYRSWSSNETDDTASTNRVLEVVQDPTETALNDDYQKRKIYFRLFQIHPVKVNFTFFNNVKLNEGESPQNTVFLLLNTLGSMSNIDNATLKLNALILEHPFVSRKVLLDRLRRHYKRAILGEFYNVIGSLDLYGNTVRLFNDIGTEMYETFYDTAQLYKNRGAQASAALLSGQSTGAGHSMSAAANTGLVTSASSGRGGGSGGDANSIGSSSGGGGGGTGGGGGSGSGGGNTGTLAAGGSTPATVAPQSSRKAIKTLNILKNKTLVPAKSMIIGVLDIALHHPQASSTSKSLIKGASDVISAFPTEDKPANDLLSSNQHQQHQLENNVDPSSQPPPPRRRTFMYNSKQRQLQEEIARVIYSPLSVQRDFYFDRPAMSGQQQQQQQQQPLSVTYYSTPSTAGLKVGTVTTVTAPSSRSTSVQTTATATATTTPTSSSRPAATTPREGGPLPK